MDHKPKATPDFGELEKVITGQKLPSRVHLAPARDFPCQDG